MIYFHYLIIYFLDRSIQKIFHLILKKEALDQSIQKIFYLILRKEALDSSIPKTYIHFGSEKDERIWQQEAVQGACFCFWHFAGVRTRCTQRGSHNSGFPSYPSATGTTHSASFVAEKSVSSPQKIVIFYYLLNKYSLYQSIQKTFHLSLKSETLAASHSITDTCTPVKFFSKLNNLFFGYFDPINKKFR